MPIQILSPNILTNTGFTYTPSEDKSASNMGYDKYILSNGSDEYWIIWTSDQYAQLEGGESYQPRYVQKFGVDGVAVGNVIQLPQLDTMDAFKYSLITSTISGDRLVYMTRESDNEGGYHFSGHIVDSAGTVNSFYYETPPNEYVGALLDVISSGDGKFLITWRGESYYSYSLDSSVYPIYAQQFNSNGDVVGSVISLPEFDYYTGAMSKNIQYVYLTDHILGDRLVYAAFEHDSSSDSYFIKGQVVDGTGVLLNEFQYSPQNARYDYFEVLSNGGNEFWVSWWGETVLTEGNVDDFYPHYAQKFDIYGNTVGDVVRLPDHNDTQQYDISLALVSGPMLGDSFVSLNTGFEGSESNTIFKGQIVDANGDSILSGVINNAEGIVNGNSKDNQLIVNSDTTEISAGSGFDTVVFSGNYADYTFLSGYSSLKSYDSSGKVVNLNDVERLQFDDGIVDLSLTGNSDVQVNSTTSGHQLSPDVAAFSDGGFIIVWASKNVDYYSVKAQLFDLNGDPSGSEFTVASELTKDQAAPSVAVSSADSYAISYGDQYNGKIKIYNDSSFNENNEYTFEGDIKEFGVDGFIALKDSYRITYYDSSLTDVGTYTSSYIDYGYDYIGGDRYIYFGETSSYTKLNAAIINSDGQTSIDWFTVNTAKFDSSSYPYSGSAHSYATATGLKDGGFVVVWQLRYSEDFNGSISATVDDVDIEVSIGIDSLDISGYGIYGQRYDYEGNASGEQFLINTYKDSSQTKPSIADLKDGGFVVVWESYGQDASLFGIYGQRYNADGNTEGLEFKVNEYSSGSQDDPKVESLPDGGFVVVWESYGQDGSGDGIFAKAYDAEGNPKPTILLGEINNTAPMLASFSMVNEDTVTLNESPLFFSAEIVSAAQVSNAIYGENLSTNSSEKLIKLTLNADTERLSDDFFSFDNFTKYVSISAAGLDIGLDWSQFEVINYNDGSSQWFNSKSLTSNFFEARQDIATSKLESVVVASLDISSTPSLTLVDSVVTNSAGEIDKPSSLIIGDIYLNPVDGISDVTITYGGAVVVSQGDGQFLQATKSLEINTNPIDAIISVGRISGDNGYLANTSVETYKGNIDQNVSTEVNGSGEMWFHQSTDMDEVKLSDANVYNFDTSINISDAIDVLRHIVDLEALTPGSDSYHAADVNNDGNINISDAIDILRHIVNLEAIDTFDLLDTDGGRVTQFDADASGNPPTWSIVANGDVNMSGSFADDYVMVVDMA